MGNVMAFSLATIGLDDMVSINPCGI